MDAGEINLRKREERRNLPFHIPVKPQGYTAIAGQVTGSRDQFDLKLCPDQDSFRLHRGRIRMKQDDTKITHAGQECVQDQWFQDETWDSP